MTTTTKGQLGVTYWFLHSGVTVAFSTSLHAVDSRVMKRGELLWVGETIRAACTDRAGSCLWDMTPEQQERAYGRVMFLPGEPPADFEVLEVDSPEWDAARAAAYAAVGRIDDPDEQRVEAARVRERFGVPASARSTTLRTFGP